MREQKRMSSISSPIRAAQYVRMSTEHQQYSIDNQSDWNARYAEAHGMEIVRTFSDVESGLNIRDGLRDLLDEVESGHADYSVVLVYDVSRWGRFQDIDESAYYEYRCKHAGVAVNYCAEQFENDGGFLSSLLKSIKRSMAGEYSRELSVKVFAAQCKLVRLGFVQGGTQGYGLRRAIIDRDGHLKQVLTRGEQKSIQTDRIILVPGPDREVRLLGEIYDRFTNNGWTYKRIKEWIDSRGLLTHLGTAWTTWRVRDVLTNEKYIGTNVFNRSSAKLGTKLRPNPPELWIRCEGAFAPVVPRERFEEARRIISHRHKSLPDAELLDRLRELWKRAGKLSLELVRSDKTMPSGAAYYRRFGGLSQAYELIGYRRHQNYTYVRINRTVRKRSAELCHWIVKQLQENGAIVETKGRPDLLRINDEFTLAIAIARCRSRQRAPETYRWRVDTKRREKADITLLIRLKPGNQEMLDYYLFPASANVQHGQELFASNKGVMDAYRFQDLQPLTKLVRRTPVEGISETTKH